MEEIGKREFPIQRIIELYREDGLELSTEQAEEILALSQKLVNIVVRQYMTTFEVVESATNFREVS